MPSLNDLQTLGGLSVTVALVFEVIKRAWSPTADQLQRFGALIAVGLGVVAATAAAVLAGHTDDPAAVGQAMLTGIFAGGLASGIYSMAQASPLPTYSPTAAGLP